MPSSIVSYWIEKWNRKLHIYVGLYFLFFIWLFAFSGLLLNHPQWEIFQFWQNRKEQTTTHTLQPLVKVDDFTRAEEVVQELGLIGEIEAVKILPKENRFRFRVLRPGKIEDVLVNIETGQAEVKTITTNAWGVIRSLHQFNGVRIDNDKEERDWFATILWTAAMDGLCFGLIFLTLSSLYMWYQIGKKRRIGMAILGVGVLCCGVFALGIASIFG
ncbi:MAG: hypothetical protein ACI8V2_001096 [Candidatus Latescibacterota bacterium]|jgi:hypothetical protein